MSNWKIIVSSVVKDLNDDYGFNVEDQPGTGMAPVQNISTDFGLLDGALFKRTRTDVREFSLVGTLSASSVEAYHTKRRDLIDVIKPDRTSTQEPIEFQYTGGGGSTLQGSAFYAAGLELGEVSVFTEAQIVKLHGLL